MTTIAPTPPATRRTRGRPREFDVDVALDAAIGVFSQRGYHAASISELKAAMRLASGSIYKAFKDKRAIFLAALDRYKAVRDAALQGELATATNGRDRLRCILRFYADASHGEAGRQGCLAVGTASELAIFDAEVAERVAVSMTRIETQLARVIGEGQADGSIRAGVDADAVARALLCLIQGLRVVGKTGRDSVRTLSVVDVAMKMLD